MAKKTVGNPCSSSWSIIASYAKFWRVRDLQVSSTHSGVENKQKTQINFREVMAAVV